MAKFTFLEVHLDGAEFTANAPGSGGGSDAEPDVSVGEVGDEDASGRGRWLATLVGLLFLVAVAVVVKKKAGVGGTEAVPELKGRD